MCLKKTSETNSIQEDFFKCHTKILGSCKNIIRQQDFFKMHVTLIYMTQIHFTQQHYTYIFLLSWLLHAPLSELAFPLGIAIDSHSKCIWTAALVSPCHCVFICFKLCTFLIEVTQIIFFSIFFSFDEAPELVLRKVINFADCTVCLDKRNASGKIEFYQDPLLYKCSYRTRLHFTYDNINSKIPSVIKVSSSKSIWMFDQILLLW